MRGVAISPGRGAASLVAGADEANPDAAADVAARLDDQLAVPAQSDLEVVGFVGVEDEPAAGVLGKDLGRVGADLAHVEGEDDLVEAAYRLGGIEGRARGPSLESGK